MPLPRYTNHSPCIAVRDFTLPKLCTLNYATATQYPALPSPLRFSATHSSALAIRNFTMPLLNATPRRYAFALYSQTMLCHSNTRQLNALPLPNSASLCLTLHHYAVAYLSSTQPLLIDTMLDPALPSLFNYLVCKRTLARVSPLPEPVPVPVLKPLF